MKTGDHLTDEELYRSGLDALTRELGVVGMIRFLNQLRPGTVDYTAERQEWVESRTIDQIQADIERLRAEGKLPTPVESR